MDHGAISGQIDRILRSRSFASKSQLRKLLEILHKNFDSQTTLKPEEVIRELWPVETRTKTSGDVATEMNRLRRTLDSYYKEEGQSDAILISLPNRAAFSPGGTQEKRWIVAAPQAGNQKLATLPRPAPRSRLKILAATTAALVLGALAARMLAGDRQPRAGRMDGSTLTIVNAEGKTLWSKSYSDGFSHRYYEQGIGSHIWFGDLEGKGHLNVLFLYHPGVSPESRSTTLICYSDRGEEKWRWTPGRDLPELNGSPPTYQTEALRVLKATGRRPPRIVVSSVNVPWYPSQIALVDSNGKTVSEYWHSGHLDTMVLADLDGDGREEIVASGISNGYRQATLIVLDPDRVFGASTEAARPELQIHGMGAAEEKYRLLFPRSDMNLAVSAYNIGGEATIEHGRIRFAVRECLQLYGCLILYEFDKDFRLLSVEAGDQFREAHAEFYRTGKDAHAFSAAEEARFRKVRCLTGCPSEFVATEMRGQRNSP